MVSSDCIDPLHLTPEKERTLPYFYRQDSLINTLRTIYDYWRDSRLLDMIGVLETHHDVGEPFEIPHNLALQSAIDRHFWFPMAVPDSEIIWLREIMEVCGEVLARWHKGEIGKARVLNHLWSVKPPQWLRR